MRAGLATLDVLQRESLGARAETLGIELRPPSRKRWRRTRW
jgi:4-aminobutyrate aminotransferase-like enzyme